MNRTLRYLHILAVMLFCGCLLAQSSVSDEPAGFDYSIKLTTLVDPNHVPMNRTVTYTVQVSWQGDQDRVDIQEVDEPLLSHLEIVGTSSATRVSGGLGDAKTKKEISYILKPTTLGMAYIESVLLRYRDTLSGEDYTLRTERIGVEVLPPVKEKSSGGFPLWLIIGFACVIVLAGLVILIVVLLKSAGKKADKGPEIIIEEAYLSELKTSISLKDGDRRDVLTALSKLFRRYLAEKFQISAMEMTTETLLEQLQLADIDETLLKKCEMLFKESDVIKFSGQEAGPAVLESAYTTVETFLETYLTAFRKTQEELADQHKKKR